jgi:hypothetical protein
MGKSSCSEVVVEVELINGTIDNKGRQNSDKCHFLKIIWEITQRMALIDFLLS